MDKYITIFLFLFLASCSGLEESAQKKVREQNKITRAILRESDERTLVIAPPILKPREPYPWENRWVGGHRRITKEHFRCHGKLLNPPIQIQTSDHRIVYHQDCGGIDGHSLPIKENREFIYPILVELLNTIQGATGKQVVITCGHRCPIHNTYADSSKAAGASKHQVGAEVDFYVEGMEQAPHAIIDILIKHYRENETDPAYREFHATAKGWANREIEIRHHHAHEDRDGDNQHPYPYITIELKYDRTKKRPVHYSWHEAHNSTYKY